MPDHNSVLLLNLGTIDYDYKQSVQFYTDELRAYIAHYPDAAVKPKHFYPQISPEADQKHGLLRPMPTHLTLMNCGER